MIGLGTGIGLGPGIAQGLEGALLATWLLQLGLTLRFAAVARRRLQQRPALASPAPAAEVVLCLRGVDPSLGAALAALGAQAYPGPWRLLVVVDSLEDPSWVVAEQRLGQLEALGQASWQGVRMIPLAARPQAGSLKSASLRQAFGVLHPSTELVALVDADAVVAPGWLAALAAGCGQAGVGAVSGNRWYEAAQGDCPGSGPGMVRAIWNGGALVLMTVLGIPWGGSLAIRRELIEPSGWRQVLATSFCEDTALPGPLATVGFTYQFRPELIALDRDNSICLRPLTRWIARQLLTARLHHRAWPLVALHGLGSLVLLLACLAELLVLLLHGQLPAASGLGAALLLYEFGCVGLLLWIGQVAGRALAALVPGRGAASDVGPRDGPTGLASAWRLLRWLPLTQLVYGIATVRAALARRVEWRGVVYEVRSGGVARLSRPAPSDA